MDDRTTIAAMAMRGMLADSERAGNFDVYARDAVKFADALLAELAETAPAKAGPSPAFEAMREVVDVLLRCRGRPTCACGTLGGNDLCIMHRLADDARALADKEHPRA